MAHHVCPWWIGYFLAHPWRRRSQDPAEILTHHVESGMTVADIGCGMGFFSLEMARMVGDDGRVICVDLQPRMIRSLMRRADRAGLADRIEEHICASNTLGLKGLEESVDFALAFAVVHEVPDQNKLFSELFTILKPGGTLLVAEPAGRVSRAEFQVTVDIALETKFNKIGEPDINKSLTATLMR